MCPSSHTLQSGLRPVFALSRVLAGQELCCLLAAQTGLLQALLLYHHCRSNSTSGSQSRALTALESCLKYCPMQGRCGARSLFPQPVTASLCCKDFAPFSPGMEAVTHGGVMPEVTLGQDEPRADSPSLCTGLGGRNAASLCLSAQPLSLSFADQSQTSLLPVTNIKAKSRGVTGKATSYTKWPKTPDRSQSFGSPNASPSSPFTHLQGKSKYISNLSLSRSNSPLGQARQQRSVKQPVSEWPRTEDPSTDGRWALSSSIPTAAPYPWAAFWGILHHLVPSLCPWAVACLPSALPVQPGSTSSPALPSPAALRFLVVLVPWFPSEAAVRQLPSQPHQSAFSKLDLEEETHRFSHVGSRGKGVC